MRLKITSIAFLLLTFILSSCHSFKEKDDLPKLSKIERKVAEYKSVRLTTDLSVLTENDKKIIPILMEVADIIDELFWLQTYGDKEVLYNKYTGDTLKFIEINYGPWDRLDGNKPFIPNVGAKPLGAQFYPSDMSYDEFDACTKDDKFNLYTMVQRDESGNITCIPFHTLYQDKLERASSLLKEAADLVDNQSLKDYLNLRAVAIITDMYRESDLAWMDIKENNIDFIVGPIQDLEDRLFGAKASFEAILMVKDHEWSKKLEKFTLLVPFLQKQLPIDEKYTKELPGETAAIGVYDIIYNKGYSNAGSKLIAINLPIDNHIHIERGNRKLHFKNTIKAKFDHILLPISNIVIDEEQRNHVKFDAFFQNSMFWEIGNALGVRNTINGNGPVKEALKEYHNILNNSKSDLLSLYFVTKLNKMGELDVDIRDNYVTFMASIFRSVRFGATDIQGKANMITFYYLEEQGAFTRDDKKGTYKVNIEIMQEAIMSIAEEIIIIQGNGDYAAAKALVQEKGFIREELYNDLVKIARAHIPKDVVFEQGKDVLGF
jgi:hypothetical protein